MERRGGRLRCKGLNGGAEVPCGLPPGMLTRDGWWHQTVTVLSWV